MHLADSAEGVAAHRSLAASAAGDLAAILDGLAGWAGDRDSHEPWLDRLREAENAARASGRRRCSAGGSAR